MFQDDVLGRSIARTMFIIEFIVLKKTIKVKSGGLSGLRRMDLRIDARNYYSLTAMEYSFDKPASDL